MHASTPFNLGTFRRNIPNLLERIQPIHKSTLFCPHSSKMSGPIHLLRVSLIKGDNPNFSEVDLRSAVPLESGQVYLYDKDSRSILPLHPFIILEACSECDEKHLFHFARPGGHMLSYASVPGGHVKSSRTSKPSRSR